MSEMLYRTGFAQRFAVNPELAHYGQTLGHHQWGVAVLMLDLFPECSRAALKEALLHDTGEPGAGADIAAPAKAKYPTLNLLAERAERAERAALGVPVNDTLSETEGDMIFLCDKLEAYLYVQTRAPWVLERPAWQQCRTKLVQLAARLGVEAQVRERMA